MAGQPGWGGRKVGLALGCRWTAAAARPVRGECEWGVSRLLASYRNVRGLRLECHRLPLSNGTALSSLKRVGEPAQELLGGRRDPTKHEGFSPCSSTHAAAHCLDGATTFIATVMTGRVQRPALLHTPRPNVALMQEGVSHKHVITRHVCHCDLACVLCGST